MEDYDGITKMGFYKKLALGIMGYRSENIRHTLNLEMC